MCAKLASLEHLPVGEVLRHAKLVQQADIIIDMGRIRVCCALLADIVIRTGRIPALHVKHAHPVCMPMRRGSQSVSNVTAS